MIAKAEALIASTSLVSIPAAVETAPLPSTAVAPETEVPSPASSTAKVTEVLELPQQVYPVFGLCLGHPAQDPEVKPRLPVSVTLKTDSYSIDGEADAIASYDEEMRNYYATRSANIKIQGWSDQMAGLLAKEGRPHMLAFLQSQGFLTR